MFKASGSLVELEREDRPIWSPGKNSTVLQHKELGTMEDKGFLRLNIWSPKAITRHDFIGWLH